MLDREKTGQSHMHLMFIDQTDASDRWEMCRASGEPQIPCCTNMYGNKTWDQFHGAAKYRNSLSKTKDAYKQGLPAKM